LGIILDVVYNHFGPDGNYVGEFSPKYFTKRYANEWGEALNFDCNEALPVREYFVSNARYWVEEFHIDGLRLDATQQIFDSSREHIVAEITRRTCEASPDKPILIVAENEPQHSRMLRSPRAGGYGLDALWNDDFHHTARVAATGRNEAYYSGYFGTPQEFLSAIKWGFLYQGQYYGWQKKTRGTPALDIEASRFIVFLENHDQVANSAYGARFHQLCGSGLYRALTAVFLLSPQTPMLFQGQEFGSSKPFRYFADHQGALADLVQDGRRAFLRQFPSLKRGDLCPPLLNDKTAFTECKLDHTEADKNRWIVQLHKDLLQLRREDSVFSQQRSDMLQGAVLGEHAFLLRYFAEENDDRLILVNLGRDLVSDTFPEPLLAAPEGRHWRVLWTSESSIYGGCAAPPLDEDERWSLPGNCTVVLRATPRIVEVAKP
jgi:maltooligosyltrehalose trehalohydrolase